MKKTGIAGMAFIILVAGFMTLVGGNDDTADEALNSAEQTVKRIEVVEQEETVKSLAFSFALRLKKNDFESKKVEGELKREDRREGLKLLNKALGEIIEDREQSKPEILENSEGLRHLIRISRRYREDEQKAEEDQEEEGEVTTSPF